MGTEKHWSQRNSGHRGTVGTEEQWSPRNIGHRGTICAVLNNYFVLIDVNYHNKMDIRIKKSESAKNVKFSNISVKFQTVTAVQLLDFWLNFVL